MPPEIDPQLDAKLAALKAIHAGGGNPRVAELLLIDWPAPDGPTYYAVADTHDLLNSDALLDQLDGPLELRLGTGIFLEIVMESGISDDRIELDFWDADDEMTRLAQTHGEGARVEVYYWFPEVELLLSEWWGHLRPPERSDGERFKAAAEFGFMSSSLPLPRRAFFTGCQAMYPVGRLFTQAEINEGDCPYNRHLSSEDGGDPTYQNNVHGTLGAGGEYEKTSGGDDWNCGASHNQAVGLNDDALMRVIPSAGYATAGFTTTASPVSGNADFKFGLQFNPDNSVTIKYDNTLLVGNASTWGPGAEFWIEKRAGRFRAYKGAAEIVIQGFISPVPTAPLYLGLAVQNEGSGFSSVQVAVGEIAAAPAFGNLDPVTGQPIPTCSRASQAVCKEHLEPPGATIAPSFLAFDTILETHVVHQTRGPNITVTSRANENNLKRPLRVIAGKRHVAGMDLLTFTVEPNTNHPEQGSVKALFAACEGPIKSLTKASINSAIIGPEHLNVRLGHKRQSQTSFSPQILNYSGTALFLGVFQGDFTQASPEDLNGEADIEGLVDVRVYTDPETFSEQYSQDRAWWILHALRHKRWGFGLDAARAMIEDFIELSKKYAEIVSVTDKDGNTTSGPRSTFNAELIDRSAQQQLTDMCLAGWTSLPYPERGKIRIKLLGRAEEIFAINVFIDRAFMVTVERKPTAEEIDEWTAALEAARDVSNDELLQEGIDRLEELFSSSEYTALATSNEEYIEDLYMAYLNRVSDPAGLAGWLAILVGGATRAAVRDGFAFSDEFRLRMRDLPVAVFSDRGSDRNICVDEDGKSTLTRTVASDADLANRIVVTYDDAAHNNNQVPLTFEDVDQQLRAGRAFGDFTRRAVEKQYGAFGVTELGEAARLGNLLLDLGEFEEGGLKNNLRVTFITWWLFAVDLSTYKVVKVDSVKLDVINQVRAEQGLEPFVYFRIRSIQRMGDLKVEVSCQAYPREYYEQMELLSAPPPTLPALGPVRNPGGGFGGRPPAIPFSDLEHTDDRVRFRLEAPLVI